jgi:hypothetical protein
MLATLGFGLIGTIIVIAVVVGLALWALRRT